MASNTEKGVFFVVEGCKLATLAVTEKVVELKRGRKVIGTEVETFDHAHHVLADFRGDKAKHGIRGIRGSIIDKAGNADPSTLGPVLLLVDGVEVPLTMVAGLTGKATDAKRNPKLDLGGETVRVQHDGTTYRVSFGVSQTGPNKRFFWGSIRPMSERKASAATTSDEDLVSLADLASV